MKIKYISILSILIFVGCKDYDPAISVSDSSAVFSPEEIMDLKGYTLFSDAVDHAGIAGEIYGTDTVTVLAPTNDAFAAYLAAQGAASITDLDAATLANVLRYHVIPSAVTSANLAATNSTLLTGKSVYLSTVAADGSLGLNGLASIVEGDLYANNGIIHAISAVLSAPADDIMSILSASTDHAGLVTELQRTGLDAVLSGTTEYTLLAPSDVTSIAAMTVADATNALNFLIFPGRLHSVEFADGRLATRLGTTASDNVQEIVVDGTAFNGVEIDSSNYISDNGLVHFVDGIVSGDFTAYDYLAGTGSASLSGTEAPWVALIAQLGIETQYQNLDTAYSYMAFNGAMTTVAEFADDAAIQAFLDRYTWDGQVALRDLDSGTKFTTGDGSNFYAQHSEAGSFSVNGEAFLSSRSTATYNGYRNRIFAGAYPTPLPSTTISEWLDASANYTLIGKAIEVAGKTAQVDAEGTTFYALHDTTFTQIYGYTAIAGGLDTLDLADDNDASVLDDFIAMIDAHTVSAVESELIITDDLPTQTNAAADEILWGLVDGNTVIITDTQDAQNNFLNPDMFDIWASNGVIHILNGNLD